MSDMPKYSLIQTLLDSLQLELRLLLDPPDGSREHPATTCLELWLCHPEYSSGKMPYLIHLAGLLLFVPSASQRNHSTAMKCLRTFGLMPAVCIKVCVLLLLYDSSIMVRG